MIYPGQIVTYPELILVDTGGALFGLDGSAWFNETRTHRYLLTRTWGEGPLMTWIMLNPSKAGAETGDPTMHRCVTFAKREGCGGIQILNLYGIQSPSPQAIRDSPDPVGASNDMIIDDRARGGLVVAAWGNHGAAGGRGRIVAERLTAAGVDLLCLGVTGSGQPLHPLARGRHRVPDSAPLLPWNPPQEGAGDAA
jgi:hypothetical protein